MTVTVKPKAPAPAVAKAPPTKPVVKAKPAPTPQVDLEDGGAQDGVQLIAKQGKATVTKQYKDGSEIVTEEDVGKPLVSEIAMANVGLSMGMTKALAPYENVKFQVSLHLPCAPEPEEINATFEAAKEWVAERVETIMQEIQDQIDA